jgi:phenylpyruvate tautomerase PptA (4-oxalocrotonate tautomerase family)
MTFLEWHMSRLTLASIGDVDGTVRLAPDRELALDSEWGSDRDGSGHLNLTESGWRPGTRARPRHVSRRVVELADGGLIRDEELAKNAQGEDRTMPFIHVDVAAELTAGQLARIREEIVEIVHGAIGSAREHVNVAIRQLPNKRIAEIGQTHFGRVFVAQLP